MKNIIKIVVLGLFISACATCENCGKQENHAKYCKSDSDCVKVAKGCCQCDGYDAVNAAEAVKINAGLKEKCARAVCTMQYCWNDITPKCRENVCTAEPANRPQFK